MTGGLTGAGFINLIKRASLYASFFDICIYLLRDIAGCTIIIIKEV